MPRYRYKLDTARNDQASSRTQSRRSSATTFLSSQKQTSIQTKFFFQKIIASWEFLSTVLGINTWRPSAMTPNPLAQAHFSHTSQNCRLVLTFSHISATRFVPRNGWT